MTQFHRNQDVPWRAILGLKPMTSPGSVHCSGAQGLDVWPPWPHPFILFLRQQSGLIPFQRSCLKPLYGKANAEAPACLWEPGTSQPDCCDLGVKIRCPSRKRSEAFTYFPPSARSDFTGFLHWPHVDSYHKIWKHGHYLLLALQSSNVIDIRERHF